MGVIVECDFCEEQSKNPNFDMTLFGNGKDIFCKEDYDEGPYICLSCVELCLEIHKERCEAFYINKAALSCDEVAAIINKENEDGTRKRRP